MREIGSSAAGSGGGRVGVGRARRGVRGPARASCGRTGSSGAVGDGELCRWAFDARAVRRATFRKSHVTIGGGRRARATSARGDGGDGDAPADDGAERGRGGVRGEAVHGEHVDGETGAARGARGVTPAPTARYPKRTESSTTVAATVASDDSSPLIRTTGTACPRREPRTAIHGLFTDDSCRRSRVAFRTRVAPPLLALRTRPRAPPRRALSPRPFLASLTQAPTRGPGLRGPPPRRISASRSPTSPRRIPTQSADADPIPSPAAPEPPPTPSTRARP